MYQQSIIILAISIFSTLSFADQKNDIAAEYKIFRQIEDTFFAADVNKKNLKPKLNDFVKKLNAGYEKVKRIEAQSSEVMLSQEGNQMAYDLEMLSPLESLAKSSLDTDACRHATHNNKVNQSDEGDATEVTALIKKICGE
ncbi:MAG: hypothetical protein H7328_03325 [Bdellovibrio sp.]|nr:hypothetical protein [Bdellovibrio sp.]